MKSRLREHFGFGILVTELDDEMNAVTFNCCFNCIPIMLKFYNQPKKGAADWEKSKSLKL